MTPEEIQEIMPEGYGGDWELTCQGENNAIKLIKKETTKARIDELELAKISPKFKIEERIAQLQAELEDK